MPEAIDGCVQPAKGPILPPEEVGRGETPAGQDAQEVKPTMSVRVGQPAPDFEAAAFVDGGFKNIRLSDYKGKWLVLCFYPGDFTFV